VCGDAVVGEEPRVDDGEVGRDDGEALRMKARTIRATMVKQMTMRATVLAQGL